MKKSASASLMATMGEMPITKKKKGVSAMAKSKGTKISKPSKGTKKGC